LIIGASGSIGTYAVQLAKRLGAEVTGVCGTSNVDLVRALGADQVIDYRRESVRDVDERWDVVFDTVGVSSFAESKPVLTDRGVFVPAVISIRTVADSIWTPLTGGRRLVGGVSMNKHEPLQYVAGLLADDALRVVVDTTFPLESIREAHRLVDSGHKTGNVVIDVA
jgi:NADPH2:quinone reductase